MMLPRWIPFAVAFWVIAFGILRLRIATRKEDDAEDPGPNYRKGGYYARSKRSHAIYGIAYLLLGCYCISMGFGYQIHFIKSCGEQTSTESTEPTKVKGGVPAQVVPSESTVPASPPLESGEAGQ